MGQQHKLHTVSSARPSTPLADLLTRLLPSLQPHSHPGAFHCAAWQRPGCKPRPFSNSQLVESRNRRACCYGSPRAAAHEEQRCAAQLQGRRAAAGGLPPPPLPPPRGHRRLPAPRRLPATASHPLALPCALACVQVWPGHPQPAACASMSSFRSFGGEFRREQRVSLAGRSRVEETRAEVLERTRRERERRRQEKLEQKSATSIQARRGGGGTCCLPTPRVTSAFAGWLAMMAGLFIETY
jgi:hypothetical protein